WSVKSPWEPDTEPSPMTVSLRSTPGTAVPAGGGSTVSNKAAPTDEPYTLLAAIEYVNAGLALVGVPDTMPVTGSSVRPAGSGGKTVKLSACPLSVGTNGVNAAPTVAVTGL